LSKTSVKASGHKEKLQETTTISKVTRKGQITIPAWFRRKNSIKEGSIVEITDQGQKLIVEPVPELLDQIGSDKGKYDSTKLRKMLDESRKHWR
jgi:AbrB family looped-hinge helix DNA binding protein